MTSTKKKIQEGAAAGTALASIVSQVDPVSGAALSTLSGLAGGVGAKLAEVIAFRTSTWWSHVRDESSDEAFERTFEYEKISAEKARIMLEGLRAALDAADDAALAPIGRLSRYFLRDGAEPKSRVFRGCAHLLRDLPAEDLGALRQLVVWLINAAPVDAEVLSVRRFHPENTYLADESPARQKGWEHCPQSPPLEAQFAIRALLQNGLVDGMPIAGDATNAIHAPRERFKLLRYLLAGTPVWEP